MQSELLEQVKTYLMALQDTICQALKVPMKAKFVEDGERAEGGGGRTVLSKVAMSLNRAG